MWLNVFKPLNITSRNAAQHWIFLGIPIIFIIGFFMHYIYEWSGNSLIVGVFAPVNESIWEHLKLSFWPMLIWWIAGYMIHGEKNNISATQWFSSCTLAELICPLVVLCFYYTYTGALGIESLILDIFSLLLGITVAQCLALHVYNNARFTKYSLCISVTILVLLAVIFAVFTFAPPHIPLFKDSLTGKYGI